MSEASTRNETLDILRSWKDMVSKRTGIRLELSLGTALRASQALARLSLEQLQSQLADGLIAADFEAGDATINDVPWTRGARYRIRSRAMEFCCEAYRDPQDGGITLRVRRMRGFKSTEDVPVGLQRLIVPVEFRPTMTLHFTPWTEMPMDCKVSEELCRLGAQIIREQKWLPSGEGDCISVQSARHDLELAPLPMPDGEPLHYVVVRVRMRDKQRDPSRTQSEKALYLDGSCFQIEQRLPIVVQPERLGRDSLVRREVVKQKSKPHDKKAKEVEFRYLPFEVSNFAEASFLRVPNANELASVVAPSNRLTIPKAYSATGIVALDYPADRFDLTVLAAPTFSALTGRPYIDVLRIPKRPRKPVARVNAPGLRIKSGSLYAISSVCLELPTEIDAPLWKSDTDPPTPAEILEDLVKGASLSHFPQPKEGMTGVRLFSSRYYLIVRAESGFPREPLPGTSVRIAVAIRQNINPLHMGVKPNIWLFKPKYRPDPDELVFESTDARVEASLNSHYLFANTYSQFLDYRDSGMSKSDDPKDWAVEATILGYHDKSGRSLPDVPPRIRQELTSEKARVLVQLAAIPARGVFIDGCPVEVGQSGGPGKRFSVEVVSSDLLLIKAERKRSNYETDVNPDDYSSPFSVGEKIVIRRRLPQQSSAKLKRQIDDLRKGRNLAAAQDVFAKVVTTPNKLKGPFEPAKETDALMQRLRSRGGNLTSLNQEQKSAISRAARTPHAYFIKGPPGTGKTQVISELVKLLAARGERVLLTSAQNKPLAEAVDRLADAHGVVAARITNKDREDLSHTERKTIWQNQVQELREGLLRAASADPMPDWQDEAVRARWKSMTGLSATDGDDLERHILPLIEECMSDVNLYAININAIASRLPQIRAGGKSANIQAAGVEPDFRTSFDTLIIDEASRVNDAEFVTAALRCRKWILVGDERQLPPFVDDNDSCYFHALCALFAFGRYQKWEKEDLRLATSTTFRVTEPATLLRDAVEFVENMWLSKGERQPFARDKVEDLADALYRQRALQRQENGNFADTSDQWRPDAARALGQRFYRLANALVKGSTPRDLKQDADEYARLTFQTDRKQHLNAQMQALQEAFSTFIMRSFFQRGYNDDRVNEDGTSLELFNDAESSGFRTTLTTQYRMIPEIADLVSDAVYDNKYLTPKPAEGRASVNPLELKTFPAPVHFIDMSLLGRLGDCTKIGTGYANAAEAEHIVEILRTLGNETPPDEKISVMVLSIYKKQTNLIAKRVEAMFGGASSAAIPPGMIWPPRFSNIDGVQGSEADVVIISLVRVAQDGLPEPKFGMFLQDMRRLNVAITRAKRKVIFVGHATTIENLCGDSEASDYLAWLLLDSPNMQRSLPYRLSEKRLREAKKDLDRAADVDHLPPEDLLVTEDGLESTDHG